MFLRNRKAQLRSPSLSFNEDLSAGCDVSEKPGRGISFNSELSLQSGPSAVTTQTHSLCESSPLGMVKREKKKHLHS